jgi:hypothetical protein
LVKQKKTAMIVVLGGKYNLYSAVLSTSAKTLTISNVIGFDLEPFSLVSVYSTTHTAYLNLGANLLSCERTLVAGLPVFTYTFTAINDSIANGDTFVILLKIPDTLADYSVLCYSASKV